MLYVANQNKKNSRRQERTTCKPNENPGPVNKIRTVQAHRIINAKALRVLSLITGFTGELSKEGLPFGATDSPGESSSMTTQDIFSEVEDILIVNEMHNLFA